MTTINVDVRIGGGQPPSSGGRGKSYVLYAPRTVVNTSAGKTIVPVPDRVELDPASGTATVTLDALPAETPYVFQFEVDNGYWKSSEIVAIVPASGTHKLADLVVLGDDFTPPAWYSKVLTAQQVVEDAAAEIPELVADAVTQDIAGRDLVDAANGFPASAAGGFMGENGRATDLLVDVNGDVIPETITRWAPRIGAAGGFLSGLVESPWYGGGFVGENGRATELSVDLSGDVPPEIIQRWYARATPPTQLNMDMIRSGPDILCVGDSLTAAGGVANRLATLTGRTVRNMGVGGETTTTILARLGVWPFLMSPAGMVIPASGSVDVTFASWYHSGGSNAWPLLQGDGVAGDDLWGTVAGVRVKLSIRVKDSAVAYPSHGAGDIYQLTRDGSGSAITLKRPEPFMPEYGQARAGDKILAWLGQNGPSDDATYAGFQALEQWTKKADSQFLFMTKPTGDNTGWTDFEKRMADRWGRRYLNVRRFLIDDALPLLGLTPTSTDLADIAAGRVPTQLRTDSVHHTAAAQQAIADWLVYPRMRELEMI
ncbi:MULTISPECIES: hypothetical protein [unclassified Microbacterium]|uniref:hypothetical protein n=1 Tax=unclassified Microbacterium TaxID=2609290 RepID=UPI003C300DBB